MQLKIGSRTIPIPVSRWLRIGLGVLLIIGGFTSILPIFGIWMLPLGIFLLSLDLPFLKPVREYIKEKAWRWFGVEVKKEPE
jgi:hypothetical protein